jgi:putative flippase GtrA
MKKTAVQFFKFGLVGASNTIIGYLIYASSLKVLRLMDLWPSVDIYISQFIMFVLSVAWSFYWNNRFVFKKEEETERNIGKALVKTYISYAFTSLILSELLLMVWVEILGINDYVAPILSLIITVPLNFVIQKFWAFKDKKNEREV